MVEIEISDGLLTNNEKNKLKMYILIEQIKIGATLREIDTQIREEQASIVHEKSQKNSFYSIFSIYFIMYFCIGILPPNIPNVLKTLPFSSNAGFGILIALNLFIGMISMLLFGYFSEKLLLRISRKRMFIITNLIWVSCYAFISIIPNFYGMILLIGIGAIGVGAFLPIGFSMISDLFIPEKRGVRFGMMHFALVLGNGCGMLTGSLFGPLLANTGWRSIYAIAGLLALIPLFYFLICSKNPKSDTYDYSLYNYRFNMKEVVLLLKLKSLLGILCTVLGSWIAMATLALWSIFYLSLDFGHTSIATFIYILAGLGALPGTILGGKLGDRQYSKGNPRGRIQVSFLGTILGVVCFLIFYGIPKLFYFGILGYFFTSFAIGNQFALYIELVMPKFRSTVNALNGIMMNIGGIIGNLLISSLIDINISILEGALFLILIIWAISSLFWIFPLNYYIYERIQPSQHKVLIVPSQKI